MAATSRQQFSSTSSSAMPYNTRRKSLSLSELGITVPKRARVVVQPSPPNTAVDGEQPPVKKSKRSHNSASPTVGDMSPPRATAIRFKDEKPKQPAALSPPPSPAREGDSKVDIEGIRDEIVVGAIQQLEKTGNRPHLVKELSAILATNIPAVERSANPSALISARLTAYLNRSWPAISPCPLAKDLSPSHPRRLFFYLTTMPSQSMPEHVDPIPKHNRIISPSLSSASAADEEDERYNRARAAMSPSPEVDLSSPELDDESCDPVGSFSSRNSMSREHPPTTTNLAHNRRAASPQLEREERDFKQTAGRKSPKGRGEQQGKAKRGRKEESQTNLISVFFTDMRFFPKRKKLFPFFFFFFFFWCFDIFGVLVWPGAMRKKEMVVFVPQSVLFFFFFFFFFFLISFSFLLYDFISLHLSPSPFEASDPSIMFW